jgi:hypothetical protein
MTLWRLSRVFPRLFACLSLAWLAVPAAAQLSTQRADLYIPQSYGTHHVGDITGNSLKDVVFLTQLGEDNEHGVLSVFTQDRYRKFSGLKRFQTPPGSREIRVVDIDADGANELMLLHESGLSLMRIENGQLQRELVEAPVEWPEELLGRRLLLTASWHAMKPGEPPLLVLPTIGMVAVFRWEGGKYLLHARARADSSAFNFGLNMGSMARRLTNYQRDDGSLGASIESARFALVLPAIYFSDMDNDGDKDMAICSPSRARASIHLNPGDGKFPLDPDKIIDRSSVTPEEALVGWVSERASLQDFNGDGLPDLFSVKRGDRESREVVRRRLFLARGPLAYGEEPDFEGAVESIASQTSLRDFNGDGLLDMAYPVARVNISSLLTTGLTGSFHYVTRFHLQKGRPASGGGDIFDRRPDYELSFSCDLSSLRETNGPYYDFSYDLTGDKAKDLVIINDLENLEIYQGSATGRFSRRPWTSLKVKRGVISIFEDMDNDGMPDFMNINQEQTARDFHFTIDFLNRR